MPDLVAGHKSAAASQPTLDGAHTIVIANDPAEARSFQDQIEELLTSHRFDEREIFSIKLALEEAVINAIKHGNQMDRDKNVTIHYRIRHDRFDVHIIDEGKGFNPEELPDPMAPENLERPCGRGLLLIRHYMTEVKYHPPGNRLSMSLVRGAKGRNGTAK